jgi:hypothetical protein
MPDLVLEYHRLKTPIDHPDLSVTRVKLEYPTADVSFAYLSAINKVVGVTRYTWSFWVATRDSFTDKAVFQMGQVNQWPVNGGRIVDRSDYYEHAINTGASAADHFLRKQVGSTTTTLATEAVDLDSSGEGMRLSISGSTLKGSRWLQTAPLDPLSLPTPTATVSATDTSFASGLYGFFPLREYYPHGGTDGTIAYLLAPASPLPPALLVLEAEAEGSGSGDDPLRPALGKDLVEVSQLAGLPDFLYREAKRYEILRAKGFADEEMRLVFGYVPQHQVDLDAVTWGAFEFSEKSPTNIIVVTGDNPYKQGAIQRQADYAKKKGLRVFDPPRNYGEAVALYSKLRGDFPHWLAGKDSMAYHALGWEELDAFQNVDFYYGELLEHKTHYDQLKQAPSWEIERRLLELKARLEKMAVLPEERDKHLRKVKELLKKGW